MRRRRPRTISLPPLYDDALRRVAEQLHAGNVSAAIRALMDDDAVTKSAVALALEAT
jgi:hypothetical protein